MQMHGIVQTGVILLIAMLITLPTISADTTPPEGPVKLIFIHHSVGENWLSDEKGGLARELAENNYFVSDTYYGWGPDGIGDRTDIVDWPEWFLGDNRDTYMNALLAESKDDAAGYDYYNRPMADPGGENRIILFKSCYPNSNLGGNPSDPVSDGPDMTVGGAKYVYTRLLEYFEQHPETLFIAMTPPPELAPDHAASAEAFSRWMTEDWLSSYPGTNVGVFDLHAVLSSPDNHHTAEGDTIVYETGHGNTLAYPTEDPHPSREGNLKATREFVPLLNYYYHRWMSGDTAPVQPASQKGPEVSEEMPAIAEPVEDIGDIGDIEDIEDITPAETSQPQEGSSAGTYPGEESSAPAGGGLILSSDGEMTGPWTTYDDGTSPISLTPGDTPGSFCVETSVLPGGWATVETLADTPQDWSSYSGISYIITADRENTPYSLVLYDAAGPEGKSTYSVSLTAGTEAASAGETVSIPWSDFSPMEGVESFHPDRARGLFFSFESGDGSPARVCIRSLSLILE